MSAVLSRSSTAPPAPTNHPAPPPALATLQQPRQPYTEEEQRWIRLWDSIHPTQHLPLNINSAFYLSNILIYILSAINEAFNAGLIIGTTVPTSFNYMNLPRSSASIHCEWLYYPNRLANGIQQRLAVSTPASMIAPAPTTPRDRAPKLNPPKPFDGTRTDYKFSIMQLNLMFYSNPDRYMSPNGDNAKIAYALWWGGKLLSHPSLTYQAVDDRLVDDCY